MAFFTTPGDCCVEMSCTSIVAPGILIESLIEDAAGKASAQHSTSCTGSMVSSSWDNSSKGGSFGLWLDSESSSIFENRSRQTMQNLNERLASYLDKVHNLEQSNAELEHKILEWYNKQGASASIAAQRNHGHFYKTIEELRAKIFEATANKYRSILQVDNIQLAVNDFKRKYEMELDMRQSIEADITGLRRVMDDVTLSRSDLELHIENLKDDLAYLKNNHEEEIRELRTHAAGNVTVEMDAAPGADLTKVLADMREQYEFMADKNRREAEARFIARSEQLQKEVGASVEQVQSRKSEITEIRRSLQGLEIELQTEFSKKKGLEALLSDAECRYAEQLLQMQSKISQYEAQLIDLRANMENQNLEYTMLLDVKNRLEMEINKYRQLLEGQDVKI
ncbi:keratin, type I cytoskeletal 13-like isoform X3 [Pleurodeles waltl]|uniref:keratin, type I cytoskeletal 13-like isoform X3 n=1 Tax=Pleurodeles waltl TaxID=8319 RepID=UPI003709B9CF